MRLEFGAAQDGVIRGRIYGWMPDAERKWSGGFTDWWIDGRARGGGATRGWHLGYFYAYPVC